MMEELTHDQASAPEPVATRAWWRRRPVQLLAAVVVVAAAVGGYLAASGGGAPQIHLRGTLRLAAPGYLPNGDGSCDGWEGFDDITTGTAVTVGGSTGQTLGIGALGTGKDQGFACVFPFDVAVPGGQSTYTVTISHRGTQSFTPAQVADGITLTLQ